MPHFIPTLAPPIIPPYLTSTPADLTVTFDSLTTTTTTFPTPLSNLLKDKKNRLKTTFDKPDKLVSFTRDKSLLPLPEIVLSSSTFIPQHPITILPANFNVSAFENIRTTVPQPSQYNNKLYNFAKFSGFSAWHQTTTSEPLTQETTVMANKWSAWKNSVTKPKLMNIDSVTMPIPSLQDVESTIPQLILDSDNPDNNMEHSYKNIFSQKIVRSFHKINCGFINIYNITLNSFLCNIKKNFEKVYELKKYNILKFKDILIKI